MLPSSVYDEHNKIDLIREGVVSRGTQSIGVIAGDGDLYVSALNGDGIADLRNWLLKVAGWQPSGEGVFLARERHLRALDDASVHTAAAEQLSEQPELFAEELRLAQRALSSITGEFTSDDLLGEIFSRFCVGK